MHYVQQKERQPDNSKALNFNDENALVKRGKALVSIFGIRDNAKIKEKPSVEPSEVQKLLYFLAILRRGEEQVKYAKKRLRMQIYSIRV
jgi:hypothetical protein